MSAEGPSIRVVRRLAEHWLRSLDEEPTRILDWRDHALQTMLLASRFKATWSLAAQIALGLHQSLRQWGLYSSWVHDLEEVVGRAGDQRSTLVARLYVALGATRCAAREWERAERALVQARGLFRELGDGLGTAETCYELARLAWNRGDWQGCLALARQAWRESQAIIGPLPADLRRQRSRILDLIGLACWRLGQFRRALPYLRRALACRPEWDRRGLGHLHHHLAVALTSLGDTGAALAHAARAQELLQECADRPGLAHLWADLSDIYRLKNDLDAAREALQRSYALWRELEDPAGLADFYRHLGLLERQAANPALARQHLEHACSLWERLGEAEEVRRCRTLLSAQPREEARREEALRRLEALREEVRARNPDLDDEQAQALVDRLVRDSIEQTIAEKKVRYEGRE